MPAAVSSPIPAALDQLRGSAPAEPAECPGLLQCLAAVPDPRSRRGVRHHLVYVLALAAAAVLTGATSLLAVGEWAADAPVNALVALGGRVDVLTGRCSVHRSPRPRSSNATGPADVCRQLQCTSSRKPIPEGYSAEKTTTSWGCHDLD